MTDRQQIIEILIATRGMSEGQTADAILSALTAPRVTEAVEGDQLPPVGSKVLIHLASKDAWVEHTVVGYFACGGSACDPSLHRVFVRVMNAHGHLNTRMLKDIRRVTSAPAPAGPNTKEEVGRIGDMGKHTCLRVGFDDDRDVYVAVCDESGMSDVEFCTIGTGGGKSPETRKALIALMAAIERDNEQDGSRDWHSLRGGSND